MPKGRDFDQCPECRGTGQITKYYYKDGKKITEKKRCWKCGGTGRRKM